MAIQLDLDKNKLELSADTAPFWRGENIPGLLDFVLNVFPGLDAEQMRGLKQMVGEVLETVDGEAQMVCDRHGAFWVTPRSFVTDGKGCPACDVEAAMRVEQQRRRGQ